MTSTPASSQPHIAAVLATTDAALQQLPTARRAYLGERPAADTACAVIHGSPGDPSGSLGDPYADLQVDFQVTAVGTGPDQALYIADAARRALLAAPAPTVPGRAVLRVWQTASQPAQRDDTVQPPLWTATAQYAIKSNPA